MGASIYGNVGGAARKAKGLYGNVNGAARKIKGAYTNVGGVARKIFSAYSCQGKIYYDGSYGLAGSLTVNDNGSGHLWLSNSDDSQFYYFVGLKISFKTPFNWAHSTSLFQYTITSAQASHNYFGEALPTIKIHRSYDADDKWLGFSNDNFVGYKVGICSYAPSNGGFDINKIDAIRLEFCASLKSGEFRELYWKDIYVNGNRIDGIELI